MEEEWHGWILELTLVFLEASNFIETIQKRQGLYIACLEEIAYNKGYITKEELLKTAEELKKQIMDNIYLI